MYYKDFDSLFTADNNGYGLFNDYSVNNVFEDFVAPPLNDIGSILTHPINDSDFSATLSAYDINELFSPYKNDNDFSFPLADYGFDFTNTADYGKFDSFDNTVSTVDTVGFSGDDPFFSQSAHDLAYYECGFSSDEPSLGYYECGFSADAPSLSDYECGFSSDSPSYGEYETGTDYDYSDI